MRSDVIERTPDARDGRFCLTRAVLIFFNEFCKRNKSTAFLYAILKHSIRVFADALDISRLVDSVVVAMGFPFTEIYIILNVVIDSFALSDGEA